MEGRDFLPTASLEHLRLRASLLRMVRRFFDERGYLDVETPLLSAEGTIDPNLTPFVTEWVPPGKTAVGGERCYLQTSPEFAMKRLLAAGATAIYQITRSFRNCEIGRLHNPEFTIVEWYRVGDTYHQQMDVVEVLVREILNIGGSFPRTSYGEAFQRHAGFDPIPMETREVIQAATSRGAVPPTSLRADDRDGWLNFLLVDRVEPHLGGERPEFLYDYPASQAALAKVRPGPPAVAERFELYVHGIEICNGYQELTDAAELRGRVREHAHAVPMPTRLLDAMTAGFPTCSGVALGFDRLVMLAAGASSLAEVMAFPFERA